MKKNLFATNRIDKVWEHLSNQTLPENKYIVLYGNLEWGFVFDTKEELIKSWYDCVRSRGYRNDIYLHFGAKHIRTVRNFAHSVSTPSTDGNGKTLYTCEYIKYTN